MNAMNTIVPPGQDRTSMPTLRMTMLAMPIKGKVPVPRVSD